MPGHRRISYDQLKRFCRPAAAAAALAVLALATANPAAARSPEENFKVRAAISLPNAQKIVSFDISYVDEYDGLYLLADRTNAAVDSVDVLNNQVAALYKANFAGAGPSPDTSGPNGVLTITNAKAGTTYLYAGDYGNGSNGGTGGLLKVINLADGSLVATIATGGTARADELCYDPKDHVNMIANDAEPLPPTGTGPYLTFIDSQTFAVKGKLFMSGLSGQGPLATNGIEQCQWVRKTGHFYVNIPEVNGPGNDTKDGAVLEIDPVAMTIVNNFDIPVGECAGPQGMAVGPFPQLLLGCNDPNKNVPFTVTIDFRDGSIINVFPNEDGSDEVYYNPGDSHYFLGESGGANPQHLGIIDALTAKGLLVGVNDPSKAIGLAGKGGNHSVAADSFTNKVFVPIAATSGATVCSSVGGDDSVGCIAVYKASGGKNEGM